MCGIFAILNNTTYQTDAIQNEFMKGQSRGPEFSKLDTIYKNMILGFHRLAINGLNEFSNQPLVINDIVLICNGEIYNFKELYKLMNIEPKTGSDCEAIIHLYNKYGIEQTLNMLDGVFAFILYDIKQNKLYAARDPFGVRPLYYIKHVNSKTELYGFSSELKTLHHFYNNQINCFEINQFTPGTYSEFELTTEKTPIYDVRDYSNQPTTFTYWKYIKENVPYFIPTFSHSHLVNDVYSHISSYLVSAVNKRCLTTERPIACLLSGGLDSSLIAALVNNFYNINNIPNKLETYSIGLEGSEDLKYARIAADYLKTNHTEIVVTEQEMFDAIPEVIVAIESYDTTTVRASIGNYLLGKYIRKHSNAKVIFNGDGSDELLGGYLYMNRCPDDIEFDKETRRLLKDIHLFDVLRSDKSISSNGLEPRTPFLDKNFANFMLSIPSTFRNHKNHKNTIEKFILRNSFSSENFTDYNGNALLPFEILWRKKEAFSDGVSSHGRSLYQILQHLITLKVNADTNTDDYYPSIETEKMYYKQIFDKAYPKCSHILPYFWMPKYTDATDPSARTLKFYSS